MVEEGLTLPEKFVVYISEHLSKNQERLLSFLYQPLIGIKAANLYTIFYSFCLNEETESKAILHSRLYNLLKVKKVSEFENIRAQLEAVGLLEVYYQAPTAESDGLYLYFVKLPKDPYDFFNDPFLSAVLASEVGESEFQSLMLEFLLHKYDLTKFNNVTKGFDEVFSVTGGVNSSDASTLWLSMKNKGIELKRAHFDYEYLVIMLESLDLVSNAVIKSRAFYDLVNRYSLIYNLTADEIKDAVITSISENRDINYQTLESQVRRIYDLKNQKIKYQPFAKTSAKCDEVVMTLENLTPLEVIQNKYGTALTSSEIAMFNQLQTNTGFTNGMLNVLIIYVTSEKNGEIPSYNYFLKIANTWIRAGVKTTRDALDRISAPSQTSKVSATKRQKAVPDWYAGYETTVNEKLAQEKEQQIARANEESLADLADFFQKKPKK